jgi:hypothetical protein
MESRRKAAFFQARWATSSMAHGMAQADLRRSIGASRPGKGGDNTTMPAGCP